MVGQKPGETMKSTSSVENCWILLETTGSWQTVDQIGQELNMMQLE